MQSLQTGGPQSTDSDKLILVTNMIRTQTTKQNSFVKKFLFNFETPSIFKSLSYSSTLRSWKSKFGSYFCQTRLKCLKYFLTPCMALSSCLYFSKFSVHQSRQDSGENYNFVTSEAKRNFLRSQPSSPCRSGGSGHAISAGGELTFTKLLSWPGRWKKSSWW